jgi:hypothetical protein
VLGSMRTRLGEVLRLTLRLWSVAGILLLWNKHRLRFLVRLLLLLLLLLVWIVRLRFRAGKGVVPALLGFRLQPLFLALVLVVAVQEVAARHEFQAAEDDHAVSVWLLPEAALVEGLGHAECGNSGTAVVK